MGDLEREATQTATMIVTPWHGWPLLGDRMAPSNLSMQISWPRDSLAFVDACTTAEEAGAPVPGLPVVEHWWVSILDTA